MSLTAEELTLVRSLLQKAPQTSQPCPNKAPLQPVKRGHTIRDFPVGAKGRILYMGQLRDVSVVEQNPPWVRIRIEDVRGPGNGLILNSKPGAVAHEDEVVLSTTTVPVPRIPFFQHPLPNPHPTHVILRGNHSEHPDHSEQRTMSSPPILPLCWSTSPTVMFIHLLGGCCWQHG